MYRIIKIGMDVHSKTYALCALEPKIGEEDLLLASTEVQADPKYILMFIENLKFKLGLDNDYDIVCGYEAGFLGYSLYNRLTALGIKCVILAPTTMLTPQGQRVKTDARDAKMIAECLGNGGYHAVHIPTDEDDAVKEYIRMRDDQQTNLSRTKQQISAFCLRHGHHYPNGKWTIKHIMWLRKLDLTAMLRETLDEYMAAYDELTAKIERLDKRIDELADQSRYQEKVKRLTCFLGIKTHTALSLIVETGDFIRNGKKHSVAVAAIARELACYVWGMMTDNIGINAA